MSHEVGQIVPCFEPEDLPGAIAKAKRIAKEGLGVKGIGIIETKDGVRIKGVGIKMLNPYRIIPNPMVEQVERAIEEMMRC